MAPADHDALGAVRVPFRVVCRRGAAVREVHFNRPGWQMGERVDLHQPVCLDDLEWLGWVLERAPLLEAITLEIEEVDERTLTEQISMLRHYLRS